MTPLICLVFDVNRKPSSVMQNSKNIFIMFLTFRKLKESPLKREVNACCDVWTTITVFPQTLERFIYQTEKYGATYFQLTSTMHPRSSKRIILSTITALWWVLFTYLLQECNSPPSCFGLKLWCMSGLSMLSANEQVFNYFAALMMTETQILHQCPHIKI